MATANTQPVTTPATKYIAHTARDGRRFLIQDGDWITHGWDVEYGETRIWVAGWRALEYVIDRIDWIIKDAEGDEEYLAEHWGDDHKVIDGAVVIGEDRFCDLAESLADDIRHGLVWGDRF